MGEACRACWVKPLGYPVKKKDNPLGEKKKKKGDPFLVFLKTRQQVHMALGTFKPQQCLNRLLIVMNGPGEKTHLGQ